MEFWNSQLTQKSWVVLQELRKKYDFILIGGWAVYLLAKQQKSKDIDIIVDINELQKLKNENLSKNDNLKKYEIKTGDIDIDIYVFYFSRLPILPENLAKYTLMTQGFKVVIPEALIVLKQAAEIERGNSVKGEKDRLDIISLLFFSNIDFNKYISILNENSLIDYVERLTFILKNFRDYGLLGLSPREFKLKKQKLIEEIKKI